MDGNGNGASSVITVTLTFDPATRQVGLNSPTNDEMVLLYMLEKAKDALKEAIAKAAEGQRIVPASAMPLIRN